MSDEKTANQRPFESMKPEAQRIAIAEACGWKILSMREAVAAGLYVPTEHQDQDAWQFLYSPDGTKMASTDFKNKRWGSWVNMLPNYSDDLNAMHEARKVIESKGMQRVYWLTMTKILPHTPQGYDWQFLNCTAAQHAEAFLRTLSLWTET